MCLLNDVCSVPVRIHQPTKKIHAWDKKEAIKNEPRFDEFLKDRAETEKPFPFTNFEIYFVRFETFDI